MSRLLEGHNEHGNIIPLNLYLVVDKEMRVMSGDVSKYEKSVKMCDIESVAISGKKADLDFGLYTLIIDENSENRLYCNGVHQINCEILVSPIEKKKCRLRIMAKKR